jgi:hypothetical protein
MSSRGGNSGIEIDAKFAVDWLTTLLVRVGKRRPRQGSVLRGPGFETA